VDRTGSPWRDLPPSLGHWNSVFTRFRDWVKADVWKRLQGQAGSPPNFRALECAVCRQLNDVISTLSTQRDPATLC
jgi:hypothetical protein